MKSNRIKFENAQGQSLSARLEMPVSGKPKAFAIFAHCFTCSKNLNAVTNISNALTNANFAVLRFDFTGLGQSEGDFADTNFSSNMSDLVSAYEYLEQHYHAPQLMIGHSLGGAATLHVAGKLNDVRAVVTIGSPADPPHVKHVLQERIEEIEAKGEATVSIGGRPFKIKKQFLDDLESVDSKTVIKELKTAKLIIHSPQDKVVEIENAAKIYQYATHPKSYISLDGADHLMSRTEDSIYAGQMIASWATRYISEIDHPSIEIEGDLVARTSAGGYLTEVITDDDHMLIADEPLEIGGTNLGPTPYGFLTAALGACTSMTMRMYADRKGWDLQEARVHLSHGKRYQDDCADCENSNSKIDHFDRVIEMEGNLDDEQKKRLLEIADKCPVHRTLHNDVVVNTTLKS